MNQPAIPETPTALKEDKRVYIFPNGRVELADVVELVVRSSGTHRVKTADGGLHVIATGWLAISITDKTADWTI